jgi:hypothetical protein
VVGSWSNRGSFVVAVATRPLELMYVLAVVVALVNVKPAFASCPPFVIEVKSTFSVALSPIIARRIIEPIMRLPPP